MSNWVPTGGPGSSTLDAVRVLIAHDSPNARQELRVGLEPLRAVKIVAEASNSEEAVDLFLRHRPEVVLVSVCMPGKGGFEVLQAIKRAAPGCVVILTTHWPEPFVEETGRLLGATAVCALMGGRARICGIVGALAGPESRARA